VILARIEAFVVMGQHWLLLFKWCLEKNYNKFSFQQASFTFVVSRFNNQFWSLWRKATVFQMKKLVNQFGNLNTILPKCTKNVGLQKK